MHSPEVVSQDEWLAARKALLKQEKALTRMRDLVAAERRRLPWVKVDKSYEFEGPKGRETLSDLFEGRRQLIVYHFMWLWEQDSGCPSCSFLADHLDGIDVHLSHHDVRLVIVTRAPVAKFAAYMQRMGWRFKWASSYDSDFNFDYGVSFTKDALAKGTAAYNYRTLDDTQYVLDEMPGASVFAKNESGDIFHTYSTYARGLDILLGAYNFLDLTPKGRNEERIMDWVRRHDEYEDAEPNDACCSTNAAPVA